MTRSWRMGFDCDPLPESTIITTAPLCQQDRDWLAHRLERNETTEATPRLIEPRDGTASKLARSRRCGVLSVADGRKDAWATPGSFCAPCGVPCSTSCQITMRSDQLERRPLKSTEAKLWHKGWRGLLASRVPRKPRPITPVGSDVVASDTGSINLGDLISSAQSCRQALSILMPPRYSRVCRYPDRQRSSGANTEVCLTLLWREPDSNHQPRVTKSRFQDPLCHLCVIPAANTRSPQGKTRTRRSRPHEDQALAFARGIAEAPETVGSPQIRAR